MNHRENSTEGGARSLETTRRIDAVCDQFEADLKAGRHSAIEHYLRGWQDPERMSLLRELEAVKSELLDEATTPAGSAAVANDTDSETVIDTAEEHSTVHDASGLKQLGRFEILECLGAGAFGSVYRARDSRLDREIALKIPHPDVLRFGDNSERFRREAQAVAAIKHDNLCVVYDTGAIDGTHYIAMEFVSGEPLSQLIDSGTPWPAQKAATLVATLARAMQTAHEHGVVHRDLKPSNVLISAGSGKPVITDFGLVRRRKDAAAELTLNGQIVGTPAYMPPEQAAGDTEAVGPASDVYSLGAILYELIAGRRPYAGNVEQVLADVQHASPRKPSQLALHVDPGLEAICLRAMSKDATDRFPSMAAFAEALEEWGEAPLAARRKTTPANAKSAAPRRMWWIAAAAVGTLAVVLGAIRLANRPHDDAEVAEKPPAAVPGPAPNRPVDPHRATAEWVIGKGGWVMAEVDGRATPRLGSVAQLPQRPFKVLAVGCENNTDVADADVRKLQAVPTLRTLYLGGTSVGDDGFVNFSQGFPRLQWIRLNGTRVTDAGMRYLSASPSLQYIEVAGTAVTNVGVRHLATVRYLQLLNLAGTQVSAAGLDVLSECPRLINLHLNETRLGTEELQALARCVALEHLSLGRCPVDDSGLKSLAGLKHLETLNLDHTDISSAGLASLAALPRLESLSVKFTDVDDEGLRHVARMKRLRDIFLEDTNITDAGLAELAKLPRLEHVDLMDTRITSSGVAQLARLGTIKRLFLNGTGVDDTVMAHLAKLSNLQTLALNNTKITDARLDRLWDLEHLKIIGIQGTRVSLSGADALKRHLDECKIERFHDSDLLREARVVTWVVRVHGIVTLRKDGEVKNYRSGDALPKVPYRVVGIDLTGNRRIDDHDLQRLKGLPALRSLKLDSARVSDAGVQLLSRLATLEELGLVQAAVSDAAVGDLKRLNALKSLDLRGSGMTADGVAGLRSALPNCAVRH